MVGIKSREAGLREVVQTLHFFGRQIETEKFRVLLLALGVKGFGHRRHTVLQTPAQRNLRGGDAVLLREFNEYRMVNQGAAP